jgi:BASS family bile acid:Na+ symporter
VNLSIVTGITLHNIEKSSITGWVLWLLLTAPLLVCLIQFSLGKWVGKFWNDSISAGQALGQKNTVVGIWLTLTFLNPLAAISPGAYVLWQNLVNGWQIWYKEKHGRLKW